ncbi:MAG: TRAP transporter small permease subunit [Burkholderiales bacterium]|nr:TRAP transporter small permease subunit [Burkholderiales bacterium]
MTRGRSLLAACNRASYRVCVVVTALLLSALVLDNLVEMAARAFFDASVVWVFEVNLLLAIWLYFLGIYQVYFRRGDISVDILLRRMPASVQRWIGIAIDVTIVGTLLMIFWYSHNLIAVQWPFKSPGLHLPNPLFTAPVAIGSILMAATMLERLLQRLESPHPLPSSLPGTDG